MNEKFSESRINDMRAIARFEARKILDNSESRSKTREFTDIKRTRESLSKRDIFIEDSHVTIDRDSYHVQHDYKNVSEASLIRLHAYFIFRLEKAYPRSASENREYLREARINEACAGILRSEAKRYLAQV